VEDVLLDPVELTETDLQEVAGGTGSCCNSCDHGPNLAIAAAVAVAVATPCLTVAAAGALAISA